MIKFIGVYLFKIKCIVKRINLNMKIRNIKIVKCLICNSDYPSVGLDSHLKHTHKITSKEYKLTYINIDKSDYKFTCLICNDKFKTERYLSHHIRINHNMDKLDYVIKHIFNNETQLCKCGCNTEVELINQLPYRRDYITGHNPNGMTNKLHRVKSKSLMRDKALERLIKNGNKLNTDIEIKFKLILDELNIKYIQQYKTEVGLIDFYLIDYNLYIEIDGSYWHPTKINNLNFQQLSNVINDIRKNKYFNDTNNLIRIRDNEIDLVKSVDDILNISRVNNINIKYDDVIISKEYIKSYIDRNGIDKVKKLSYLYIKLIREYITNDYIYPDYEINDDIIKSLLTKINDNSKSPTNHIFNNNISNTGVKELKTIFKNYWKSKYKNNPSPYDIFNDNSKLKKVIENRLYDNGNDFSLKNINRGMGVLRYSISFFKPSVANSIYKHFIGDKNDKPIVIDPCSGFGGRMLGFISAYPNGKYIGIEPNKDTYTYLKYIRDTYLSNYDIELYNVTQEQFIEINPNIQCDLTFTSIPYYDKENYYGVCNTNYTDIDDWSNKFIGNLIRYPNLVVNLPFDLLEYINSNSFEMYYLKNNISNFNVNTDMKATSGFELILKLI